MLKRKRGPSERAIIYAGILGNLPLGNINELLKGITPPCNKLNKSSYDMLRKSYRQWMIACMLLPDAGSQNPFGDSIYHPRPIGDLDLD